MTLRRNAVWLIIFVIALGGVTLAAAQAFAAEGESPPGYLNDVVVTFGLVTVMWSSVHMGAINILKGISIQGEQLLNSKERIWLANAALGIIGLTIASVQDGTTFLAALIQAVLAVLAGVGVFELGQVGKKAPAPTGSE